MALEKRPVVVPLATSRDGGTDPLAVPATKLLEATNVVQTKDGALSKRLGASVVTRSAQGEITSLIPDRDGGVLVQHWLDWDTSGVEQSPSVERFSSAGVAEAESANYVPSLPGLDFRLLRSIAVTQDDSVLVHINSDLAVSATQALLSAVVWAGGATYRVYSWVFRTSDWQAYPPGEPNVSSFLAKQSRSVSASGALFLLMSTDVSGAGYDTKIVSQAVSNLGVMGADTNIATDKIATSATQASSPWDACVVADTYPVIAYVRTNGDIAVRSFTATAGLVQLQDVTIARPDQADYVVSVFPVSATDVVVAWQDNTGAGAPVLGKVYGARINVVTGTTEVGATELMASTVDTVSLVGAQSNDSSFVLFRWHGTEGTITHKVTKTPFAVSNLAALAATKDISSYRSPETAQTTPLLSLATKPLSVLKDGTVRATWLGLVHNPAHSSTPRGSFLLATSDGVALAKMQEEVTDYILPYATLLARTLVYLPQWQYRSGTYYVPVVYDGREVRIYSLNPVASQVPYAISENQVFIGGTNLKQRTDGIDWCGYLQPPVAISAVAAAGAGIDDGAHQYCAILTRMDSDGRIHRSRPSDVVTVTHGGGNNQTTLTILATEAQDVNAAFTLAATSRFVGRPSVSIYRTEAGGTEFHKIYDRYSSATTSVTDTATDAAISDNELLYTDDSIVPNDMPPPVYCLASFKDRVLVVPQTDRDQIWVSKSRAENIGLEFSAFLKVRTNSKYGSIVALEAMDDLCAVFHTNAVQVFAGEGPSNIGSGGYQVPATRSLSQGAVSRNAVIGTSEGIVFKSKGGWHLLDPGMNVQYIGNDVADYDSVQPLRCVVDQNERVRCLLSSGVVLVLDLRTKTWAVWTTPLSSPVDIAVSGDNVWWALSDGTLLKEATVWKDNSSSYQMLVDTGFIELDKFGAYQRLYEIEVLGTWKSSHRLRVSTYFDGSTSAAETKTVTLATDPAPTLVRLQPARQRCTSVRVRVETLSADPVAGTEEFLTLTAVRFTLGAKSKYPAAKVFA